MQFSKQHKSNADHLLLEPDQLVLHQLYRNRYKVSFAGYWQDDCVNVPVSNYSMKAQYHSEVEILAKLCAVTLPNSDSDEFLDRSSWSENTLYYQEWLRC